MALSKALIGELRVILREEYGVEVSETEVAEIGQNFVQYFDHLIKIVHRAEHQVPSVFKQYSSSEPKESM